MLARKPRQRNLARDSSQGNPAQSVLRQLSSSWKGIVRSISNTLSADRMAARYPVRQSRKNICLPVRSFGSESYTCWVAAMRALLLAASAYARARLILPMGVVSDDE